MVIVDNLLNSQVFKLKGRLFTITVLQMFQSDLVMFEKQIKQIVVKAPKLLYRIPIVLDCSNLNTELASLMPYLTCLKQNHLYPVGVQGPQTWLNQLAIKEAVPVFQASSAQDKAVEMPAVQFKAKAEQPKVVIEPVSRATKIVHQPVRSGQQVVSQGADLIVIASVGHGAELLSDGHIHVYGPLRGRALAGITGDRQARIFCTQLDAELVSIAGVYRLRESIPVMQGPCQIFIQDERLQILPL